MQDGYKETKIGRIPGDWFLSRASEVIQLRHGYQFRNYDFVEEEGIPIIKIGMLSNRKIPTTKPIKIFNFDIGFGDDAGLIIFIVMI